MTVLPFNSEENKIDNITINTKDISFNQACLILKRAAKKKMANQDVVTEEQLRVYTKLVNSLQEFEADSYYKENPDKLDLRDTPETVEINNPVFFEVIDVNDPLNAQIVVIPKKMDIPVIDTHDLPDIGYSYDVKEYITRDRFVSMLDNPKFVKQLNAIYARQFNYGMGDIKYSFKDTEGI